MKDMNIEIQCAHTYLCGHLNTKKSASDVERSDSRWKREIWDDKKYRTTCNIYYESFIDSLVEVEGRKPQDFYKGTAHLTMEINTHCQLRHRRFGEIGWNFMVCSLHLFFFPYDICLFAIEISEDPGCDPDKLTFAHNLLRGVNEYYEPRPSDPESWSMYDNAPEYIKAITPLLKICEVVDGERVVHVPRYADLTCTGNKLKAFQIFRVSDLSDEFLYELGSMSPIGCVNNSKNNLSPSRDYFEHIMANNTISAFRNWKALVLLDSLTVIRKDGECTDLKHWHDSYFRLIYIHAYYQKTLLFVVNNQFRSDVANGKCENLLHQMKEQEHWYAFSNISYNFLPQMIYQAIDTGLEIASEREQLHHYLVQEAERQESLNERRLGKLLSILTILTVLSALYDGTSLVSEILGISSGSCPYRWIAAVLSGVVVLIFMWWIWSNYYKRRNRL